MSEALAYPACCTDCPCPGSSVIPLPSGSCACSFIVVENVAAGRAFNPATIVLPASMWTQGGLTPGDGYGKFWNWIATSFAVDDGSEFTVVMRPVTIDAGSPGRWEQAL